jgi:hypothetical protein
VGASHACTEKRSALVLEMADDTADIVRWSESDVKVWVRKKKRKNFGGERQIQCCVHPQCRRILASRSKHCTIYLDCFNRMTVLQYQETTNGCK